MPLHFFLINKNASFVGTKIETSWFMTKIICHSSQQLRKLRFSKNTKNNASQFIMVLGSFKLAWRFLSQNWIPEFGGCGSGLYWDRLNI